MNMRYNGPSGKNDKNRLYILLYDHTDNHAGRFSMDYLFGRHFYRDHVLPHIRYGRQGLKIGNEYGGGWYDNMAEMNAPIDSERFEFFKDYIRESGADIVGGTYSQPISSLVGEEAAIRQFTYGLDAIRRHLDRKVEYYAFSENTGYSYLPQILLDFGFKGALLRSHYQPMGHPPEYNESLVLWEGPDKSAIPAIPSYANDNIRTGQHGMQRSEAAFIDWPQYGGYCPGVEKLDDIIDILNRYYDEKKEQGIEYIVMSVVEDTNFNSIFQRLFPRLKDIDPEGEKYCFVTLEEALNLIPSENAKKVFPSPNQWFYSQNAGHVGNSLARWNAYIHARLTAAETLESWLALEGCQLPGGPQGDDRFDRAFRQHLNAEAHDGYEVPGTTKTAAGQLIEAAELIDAALTPVISRLISRVNSEGDAILLFNTQSFRRCEPVSVVLENCCWRTVKQIFDAMTREEVPFDVTACDSGRIMVTFPADMPAMSHAVYGIEWEHTPPKITLEESNVHLKSEGFTIKSGSLAIRVGADGTLESIQDGDCPIIAAVDGRPALSISANFYSPEFPEDSAFFLEGGRVTQVETGSFVTRLRIEGTLKKHLFYHILTIYKGFLFVDLRTEFYVGDNEGIGYPPFNRNEVWGEALKNDRRDRLNLNLNPAFLAGQTELPDADEYNSSVNLTRYTPFYPERYRRESKANTLQTWPDTMNRHIYDAHTRYWLDVSARDGNTGFLTLAKGSLFFTFDGRRLGLTQLQTNKYYGSKFAYSREEKLICGGENDDWRYVWEYRLIPHGEKLSETDYRSSGGEKLDAHRMGLAFGNPLIAAQISANTGPLPARHCYFGGLEDISAVSTGMKVSGGSVYLRMYSYRPQEETLPFAAERVHMDYSPMEDLDSGSVMLPYRILTLKIK